MYKAFCGAIAVSLRILFGIRIEGRENIPTAGGAIIAANHVSNYDPFAITAATKRVISYMAKEELFRSPILRFIFTRVHAFPVKRGRPDPGAIRRAIEIIKSGGLLGMFPEGSRNQSGELRPMQGGAPLVALKTGAPIIPVAIRGTAQLRFRQTIVIRIGEAIQFDRVEKVTRASIDAAATVISQRLKELLGN